MVVGLFAIAEMLVMAQKGEAIASIDHKVGGKDVFEGIKETFKRWKLVLQCSAIGTVIGALPGIGGITASFLAYGYAAQTSKEKDKFGKGAIDGVIGPESANNAKEGGALIPTLGFGIPGSAGMAILMGAMMMFGIAPGPNFLVNHTPILYGMAIALVLANLVAAVLLSLFQLVGQSHSFKAQCVMSFGMGYSAAGAMLLVFSLLMLLPPVFGFIGIL